MTTLKFAWNFLTCASSAITWYIYVQYVIIKISTFPFSLRCFLYSVFRKGWSETLYEKNFPTYLLYLMCIKILQCFYTSYLEIEYPLCDITIFCIHIIYVYFIIMWSIWVLITTYLLFILVFFLR